MLKEIENEFNEAVEIRQELNNVLWKEYKDLQVVFDALFNETGGLLKKLSDLNYYQGGYPGENTPAKIDSLFTSVGRVAKYYSAMGRLDEVNNYLRPFGLAVTETAPMNAMVTSDPSALNADKKGLGRAVKAVRERYSDFDSSKPAHELLEWFLDKTHALQATICARADEIKVDIFDRVSVINGDIDKGGFNTAVNQAAAKRTKVQAGKDAETLMEKVQAKADTMRANGDLLEEAVIT